MIDVEWMRAFTAFLARTGGTVGTEGIEEYAPLIIDSMAPPQDASGQESLRAVDELRNELASAVASIQTLQSAVDELAALIEGLPMAAA
jgi:hypothetical protein